MAHDTTPNPVQQVVILAEQLQQARAELAAYQAAFAQLAEPTARRVVQALDAWCDMAENPRHPNQLNALKLVRAWQATMRRVEEVASPLHVASSMPQLPVDPKL